jgi:hypothetical protein
MICSLYRAVMFLLASFAWTFSRRLACDYLVRVGRSRALASALGLVKRLLDRCLQLAEPDADPNGKLSRRLRAD